MTLIERVGWAFVLLVVRARERAIRQRGLRVAPLAISRGTGCGVGDVDEPTLIEECAARVVRLERSLRNVQRRVHREYHQGYGPRCPMSICADIEQALGTRLRCEKSTSWGRPCILIAGHRGAHTTQQRETAEPSTVIPKGDARSTTRTLLGAAEANPNASPPNASPRRNRRGAE